MFCILKTASVSKIKRIYLKSFLHRSFSYSCLCACVHQCYLWLVSVNFNAPQLSNFLCKDQLSQIVSCLPARIQPEHRLRWENILFISCSDLTNSFQTQGKGGGDKAVKLVGRGSVINGGYPNWFNHRHHHCFNHSSLYTLSQSPLWRKIKKL